MTPDTRPVTANAMLVSRLDRIETKIDTLTEQVIGLRSASARNSERIDQHEYSAIADRREMAELRRMLGNMIIAITIIGAIELVLVVTAAYLVIQAAI